MVCSCNIRCILPLEMCREVWYKCIKGFSILVGGAGDVSHVLLVGLGGALGAMARYGINQLAVSQLGSSFVGTFIANISGTFLLGLLVGFLSSHPIWPAEVRIFLTVGFLASYTTFSTLSVGTIQLLQKGDLSGAVVNLGASVVLGLTAAVAGIMFGRAI